MFRKIKEQHYSFGVSSLFEMLKDSTHLNR